MSDSVAIILVNYINYNVTIECLDSLKNLNGTDYRIYVVENGSNNESKEILLAAKDFYDFKLITSEENLGFAGGNNIAIKQAINEGFKYVLLLNNDTEVASDFLEKLLKHASSSIVAVPKIYYFDEPEKIWYAGGYIDWVTGDTGHYGAGEKDGFRFNNEREVEFATGCCILIHKDIIKQVGYLDESYFMYYEDTDYSARLKQAGISIYYVPNAKIWHKVGASNNGEYSLFMAYYMAKNRVRFVSKYSKKYIYRCYVRTFLSGIKGYIFGRNSKISIYALRDFIKENK